MTTVKEKKGKTERMSGDEALACVEELIKSTKNSRKRTKAGALLVHGAPRSGKTRFALASLRLGLDAFGDRGAVMITSSRRTADRLNAQIVVQLDSTRNPRIVRTLPALAFSILNDARTAQGLAPAKLLSGAEQDALLTGMVNGHITHVEAGEPCKICNLLMDYLDTRENDSEKGAESGNKTIDAFRRCQAPVFITQLRDMLSRLTEAGVTDETTENELLKTLDMQDDDHLGAAERNRLHAQWKLVFALRKEYDAALSEQYAGEMRGDSTYLIEQATRAVKGSVNLPSLFVVDDAQDVTLSGMRFLQALNATGVRLVMVECCDESVQMFRGAYPEFLAVRMSEPATRTRSAEDAGSALGRLGAKTIALEPPAVAGNPTYRDSVCSGLSSMIDSDENDLPPVAERPWKMDMVNDEETSPLMQGDTAYGDTISPDEQGRAGLSGCVYSSSDAETRAVIRGMQEAHLSDGTGRAGVAWNDMALISHDNATLMAYGEAMREANIPTRFVSLTSSFADDPTIQGLLSLVRLGLERKKGLAQKTMPVKEGSDVVMDLTAQTNPVLIQQRAVHADVMTYLRSPLIVVAENGGRPVRLDAVRTAVSSLRMMLLAVKNAKDAENAGNAGASQSKATDEDTEAVSQLAKAAALAAPDATSLNDATLLTRLVVDDSEASALLYDVFTTFAAGNPDMQALCTLVDRVRSVASAITDETRPADALWTAWQACDVAENWQLIAVDQGPEGRIVNERIDMVMRLFDYAKRSEEAAVQGTRRMETGFDAVKTFIDRVGTMDVVADSLARTAPEQDAVTLTTPAGAVGDTWPLVWIVGVQNGTWPNMAPRGALFGSYEMAELMLRGSFRDATDGRSIYDWQMAGVLRGEEKSFLVALTRATRHVWVSAVRNDENAPSDFLTTLMPIPFRRETSGAPSTSQPDTENVSDDNPVSISALIEKARVTIFTDILRIHGDSVLNAETLPDVSFRELSPQAQDAVRALRYLSESGYSQASPDHWPFAKKVSVPQKSKAGETKGVSLNPSQVDALWACPVCALLAKDFAGPEANGVKANFGSVIHKVAQHAVESKWDRLSNVDKMKENMRKYYNKIIDESQVNSPHADFETRQNSLQADTALSNIATYFESVRTTFYVGEGDNGETREGTSVECEKKLDNATFTLNTVFQSLEGAYTHFKELHDSWLESDSPSNASDRIVLFDDDSETADTEGEAGGDANALVFEAGYHFSKDTDSGKLVAFDKITPDAFMKLLSFMAGGFADGLTLGMPVTLRGRLDRVETLKDANGKLYHRIVDYKAVSDKHTQTKQHIDLQLVCYQLGLAAPTLTGRGGEDAWTPVSAAALFDVKQQALPAANGSKAWDFAQMPLFIPNSYDAGAKKGEKSLPLTINDMPYGSNADSDIKRCADPWFRVDDGQLLVPVKAPTGVDSASWTSLRAFLQASLPVKNDKGEYEGGTCVWWVLAMLSRVFFAASVALGQGPVPLRPAADTHVKHCAYKRLCSACGGHIETVMGFAEPMTVKGN